MKGAICGLIPGLHTNALVYDGMSAVEASAMVGSQAVFQIIPALLWGAPLGTGMFFWARRHNKGAVINAIISIWWGLLLGLVAPKPQSFMDPLPLLMVFLIIFEEPHIYLISGLLQPFQLDGFFMGGFTLPYLIQSRPTTIKEGRHPFSWVSVILGIIAGWLSMVIPGLGTPAQMAVLGFWMRIPSFHQFTFSMIGFILGMSTRWYPKIYTLKMGGVEQWALILAMAVASALLMGGLKYLRRTPDLKVLLIPMIIWGLIRGMPFLVAMAAGFLLRIVGHRRVSLMGAVTIPMLLKHL